MEGWGEVRVAHNSPGQMIGKKLCVAAVAITTNIYFAVALFTVMRRI